MSTSNNLLEALNWRYAVKAFDANKKISQADWDVIERVLVLTPSSYGLQPWKFVVVQDASLRAKLREHSWGQPQVTDCSHLVVFLARKSVDEEYVNHFIQSTCEARGLNASDLEGYRQMMLGDVVHGARSKIATEWAARQVYIALGNLMTSAAILGIDACPMEGLDPQKYNEILQVDSNYTVVCACPLGYRSSEDKYASAKKVRFDKNELILFF
jgi:nitroreductase